MCKLLDKASQRRTKQTDGGEDVREHFSLKLRLQATANEGAIWISTSAELMAPYAYFITDAHPQSQRGPLVSSVSVVLSLRTMFGLTARLSQRLKTTKNRVYGGIFFFYS